jgi:NAD(P)-dependent dehydrogenase (short-subunit alcohol dehydrogenase family)
MGWMPDSKRSALIIGASRGLGLALADEYLRRGWRVVATVRGEARTGLHALRDANSDSLEIENVDIARQEQISALRDRLNGRTFDLLFVNAGVAHDPDETVGQISTDEFIRVMVTNALSPMRVIEALGDLVSSIGTIGVMSSGLGSVANNEDGGWEVYRGSKAALNTLMRSYAARHRNDRRSLVIMAPGWVRTDMGGPHALLDVSESIPRVVDTISAQAGKPGLRYLNYQGQTVRW